jgi:pyruvate dehydrogenase E2 component (dihydrolipoamide acetyltransferase)
MSAHLFVLPDIGGFEGVGVIEVHVKPGDSVKAEDPIITLESDKATMEIPAPYAGVVRELKVAVGDKLSEGAPLAVIEPIDGTAISPAATAAEPPAKAPAPPAPAAGRPAPAPRRCRWPTRRRPTWP